MDTVKIKSTHPETQGEYVVINAESFNHEKHELFDPPKKKEKPKPEETK